MRPKKIEKKQEQAEKKIPLENKDSSLIEAPLPETAAPEQPARLGAQNHKTAREQKTLANGGRPGAPATALQNGPLTLERVPDLAGKLTVPKNLGKDYESLLPNKLEVINFGYNDYLHDKNLPTAPVLDVNTTDYRFIAYFTSVRKSVDLAYFDVGPSLRETPHIRAQLQDLGKVNIQGSSVVQLKIARSGLLVDSKLIRSSGDKDVDAFWSKVLNLAAPYPPLPRDYPSDELVFTYTLYYDLVIEGGKQTRKFAF